MSPQRFFTPWRCDLGLLTAETLPGLKVTEVVPDGFAAEAGIAPGDVILYVDGMPIFERPDLWDFQANIEGALVGFEGLRPVLKDKDPELDQQIAVKFAAVQALLDAQRVGAGFKSYDQLSQAEVKELSDAVNALSEPLSKLAAAVI